MNSKFVRLLVGFNTPPILGSVLFFLYLEVPRGFNHWVDNIQPINRFQELIELIGFAYLFIGVQAILFAFLFDFLVLERTNQVTTWLILGATFGSFSLGFFGIPFIVIGAICGIFSAVIMGKLKLIQGVQGA